MTDPTILEQRNWIYCPLVFRSMNHKKKKKEKKLKASPIAASIFLYLQRRKAWIQIKRVFFVVIFLLKLHPTRKLVDI